MVHTLIKFTERDVIQNEDVEVLVLIKTDIVLTQSFKCRLEEEIENIKQNCLENEESWDTDSIVLNACEKVFGEYTEIEIVTVDFEIEFEGE